MSDISDIPPLYLPKPTVTAPADWVTLEYGDLVSTRERYRVDLYEMKQNLNIYRNHRLDLLGPRGLTVTEGRIEQAIMEQLAKIHYLSLLVDRNIEEKALKQARLLFETTTR